MSREYVAGFLFHNLAGSVSGEVLLVHKLKGPSFNVDRLNAIGGKLKLGEAPTEAQVREFGEETGVRTEMSDWERFLTLHVSGNLLARVTFFRATLHVPVRYKTEEAEPIVSVPLNEITVDCERGQDAMRHRGVLLAPNLPWILPLAMNRSARHVDADEYHDLPFEVVS